MKTSCCLAAMVAALSLSVPAQTFGGPLAPPLAIPDGAQGPCAAGSIPAVTTVTVPPGVGNIVNFSVTVGLTHSWYGDVTLTITGPTAATVSLLGPTPLPCAGFGDSSDLNGLYTFNDAAAQTSDAAALAVGATVVITPGSYIGDNSLLATFGGTDPTGVWTFTLTDIALNDLGTCTHASVTINCLSESYTVSQPGGPGTPTLFVNQGCNAEQFVRVVQVGNAGVPTGWFFGMNIPFGVLLSELTFGYPFVGFLPPAGIDVFALPAGILPTGTPLSLVGFHFDTAGNPVLIVPAFVYTIL